MDKSSLAILIVSSGDLTVNETTLGSLAIS